MMPSSMSLQQSASSSAKGESGSIFGSGLTQAEFNVNIGGGGVLTSILGASGSSERIVLLVGAAIVAGVFLWRWKKP